MNVLETNYQFEVRGFYCQDANEQSLYRMNNILTANYSKLVRPANVAVIFNLKQHGRCFKLNNENTVDPRESAYLNFIDRFFGEVESFLSLLYKLSDC